MATIKFYPSQIGSSLVTPLSFTASPIKLLFQDLWCALINLKYAPGVFLALTPTPSGDLDELYPSLANLFNLALHAILFFLQFFFLLSIPVWILLPVWTVAIGFTMFWMFNFSLCWILNGSQLTYESDEQYAQKKPEHAHEQWLFLNGVCVGNGIIFDTLECVIQRSLNYASTDIRTAYRTLKSTLYDENITRVILILHSQGAIEGSMIVDWLLAEIPQDLLQKLEIYTFGNAANHFNNPHLHLLSQKSALTHPNLQTTATTTTVTTLNDKGPDAKKLHMHKSGNGKTIPHIEHYAHTYDFVSRWGVLYYTRNPPTEASAPRFMGRVFEKEVSGHMFVQHYLDGMFPLSKSVRKRLRGSGVTGNGEGLGNGWDWDSVDEGSQFMGAVVENGTKMGVRPGDKLGREGWNVSYCGGHGQEEEGTVGRRDKPGTDYMVGELSRLWLYRNGRSPKN
ncbi:alpha beta-Hydrolase protein [Rutstroemia sp. NJR-2017a WRK4]|nr:alpha beta-Hydrolase protein [Rutstroemia sp. NJR-2017a WRK4]